MLSAADSFSLLNALFGITSITALFYNNIWLSFSLILLAVLADGMDGWVARRYGGNLPIIDEFADMISFVAAPYAMISYFYSPLILPFCYFYVLAAIVHLINYHMHRNNYFIGITTPAAAIIVTSMTVLHANLLLEIIAVTISSALMITPLKYPRIEGIAKIISPIIILLAIILGKNYAFFTFLLLISTIIYAIAGPFYARYHGEMM